MILASFIPSNAFCFVLDCTEFRKYIKLNKAKIQILECFKHLNVLEFREANQNRTSEVLNYSFMQLKYICF